MVQHPSVLSVEIKKAWNEKPSKRRRCFCDTCNCKYNCKDDSSVRDIRITHLVFTWIRQTITPEKQVCCSLNEQEREALWFIAPFPDPKPFLAFWSQPPRKKKTKTKKGKNGLICCCFLGWNKKCSSNRKNCLNRRKIRIFEFSENYVETHARLKAKRTPTWT